MRTKDQGDPDAPNKKAEDSGIDPDLDDDFSEKPRSSYRLERQRSSLKQTKNPQSVKNQNPQSDDIDFELQAKKLQEEKDLADAKFASSSNQYQAYSGKFGPDQNIIQKNSDVLNHADIELNNLNSSSKQETMKQVIDKLDDKNAIDTGNFTGQVIIEKDGERQKSKKDKKKKSKRRDDDETQDNIRIDTYEDEEHQEQKAGRSKLITIGGPLCFLIFLLIIIIVSTVGLKSPNYNNQIMAQQNQTLDNVTRQCYFDISISGESIGRVKIGLFGLTVPLTVRNFAELCTGKNGISTLSGSSLSYKNTMFYSIDDNFAYGGDINQNNGQGGESIYGWKFNDENFQLGHSKPYLLSMTNNGVNQNTSKFFITFTAATWLDGQNVVFGEVLEGFDVIDRLSSISTYSGVPTQTAMITECGEIDF